MRPWLFRMDPEDAHRLVMRRLSRWRVGGGLIERWLRVDDSRLRVSALGLDFGNPVGLAAGLDKHCEAVGAWPRLGFGFVEVGTVTPKPQEGNPRPRIFRLPAEGALVNRMGFNSEGAAAVAARLTTTGPSRIPLGLNIGKNRTTPNEEAVDDLLATLEAMQGVGCSYVVINVSSPNTPGLRDLQAPSAVRALVEAVVSASRAPVLVKVAPDFAEGDLEATVGAVLEGGAAGIVATNTTLSRQGVPAGGAAAEAGGLSGRPLRARATECVRRIRAVAGAGVPIVGVGGIFTAEDAYERIRAGAALVQVYTGLIYEGPAIARKINRGLLRLLERDGVPNVAAALGVDAR